MTVPEARLERFSAHGSTFLSKRFDRDESGKRIHFASAMTMLGKADRASATDGSSYLEIVEWIRANGAEPRAGIEGMRMAFRGKS